MNLKNIFSMINRYEYNNLGIIILKEKIITIFGYKFILKKKPSKELQNIIGAITALKSQNIRKVNYQEDLIKVLVAAFSADEDDLFCFCSYNCYNPSICIFSKQFFKLDKQFIIDFLSFYFKKGNSNFYILDRKSRLYLKHITKSKNELCWRYRCERYYISYLVITKTDNKIMLKRGEFQNENEISSYTYDETTSQTFEYIKGVCLKEFIKNSADETKKIILKNFFDYIFKNYPCPEDKECVITLDYQTANFIIDENGNFRYIDKQSTSDKKLPKQQMIYRVLRYAKIQNIKEFFDYFTEIYHLKNDFYICENDFNHHISETAKKENLKDLQLFEKYFGSNALMPDLDDLILNKN